MFKQFFINGGVTAPDGFFADGANSGIKDDSLDLAFIYSDPIANIGAVFTSNKFQASPLQHFQREKIEESNFILINSKNANAMTGERGIQDIYSIFSTLSKELPIYNPVMSSTGVIGSPLPVEKIVEGAKSFDLNSKNHLNASKAIMTTDTRPKEIAVEVQLPDGRSYRVGGMAKGAGMINPSMATMLAFITTDLKIDTPTLNRLLRETTKTTFNAISVDGDTSTNDSVFLMANGKKDFFDEVSFRETLHLIMKHLALEIVKDGEGAKKLVAFRVTGARSDRDAEKVAKTLSNSLLVKTAIFGEDPNWGRIAMAIGASGVEVCEKNLTIAYEDIEVYRRGENLFTPEVEEKAYQILRKSQFSIYCDLGLGDGEFTSYTCDIGYEYVRINADYRT